MTMRFTLAPDDTPDRTLMGGKAWALASLGQDFPVPPWFVVTPLAFGGEGLREAAAEEIEARLASLPSGLFAVRSSAAEEDAADSSFAGQLESFLEVPAEVLLDKVRAVRDSAFTESVDRYRRERGQDAAPRAPAVIVQQMVAATRAGVAFSRDPVNPGSDEVVIAAAEGLADRLVGGEVAGDHYRLSRDGRLVGSTPQGPVPLLNAAEAAAVARLALQAETHFGSPQDIEWAIGDRLYIVQSRPITTLGARGAPREGARVIWDNSNIVESYSGVTAPLTFSFARSVYAEVYRAFCLLMGVSRARIAAADSVFENMLGSIRGHAYYNLLNWYRTLAMFPGFKANRAFMEQMMGVGEALPVDILEEIAPRRSSVGERLLDWLRLARTLLRLIFHGFTLHRTIDAFYARLETHLAEPDPPLAERDLCALVRHYRDLEEALLSRWDAPLINDFLCMIAFGLSRKLVIRWLGEEAGAALHNHVMIGQGDIVSAEPARRIKGMAARLDNESELTAALARGDASALSGAPELAAEVADYLAKFGDRCTQELKLESITLDEDPTPLLQAIAFAAMRGERPSGEGQGPSLEEAFRGKAIKGLIARPLTRWARGRVRDRENLRFERTRVFGRVRRIFLAMGRRLVEAGLLEAPRDIFYLELAEALGLVEGTATTENLKGLVALRKEEAARFAAAGEPPNRLETCGAVLVDLARNPPQAGTLAAEGESREGLGCCRGVVRGVARVIRDPRGGEVTPGDILVARHTDPGWIALFSNAAGILVERGSLLSHSAIVAREMNIPAIVAIAGLMDWLESGDVIEMDGTTGRVVKVEEGRPGDD
jgi:pyruvate,water dikinase